MANHSGSGLHPLGNVAKAQGTRGGFLMEIRETVIPPEQIDVIYIRYPEQQWVPYRVDEWSARADRKRTLFFVRLEEITSRSDAEMLRGHEVMTDQLPDESRSGISVIGYDVYRDDNSHMGTVQDTMETPGYQVLVVQGDEKQILIPEVDEFVSGVDHESKQVHVQNTTDLESLE